MKPFASEMSVIEAAEELAARLGSDPNHTVAAAAMDASGTVHTAVNVYHFTGGPCAELVVMGAAAAAGAGPLLIIAAAGDQGRGLIPPCGRCRQAMLDLHPDVLVAVPGAEGPLVRPIRKLLPESYYFPDTAARRIVRFNRDYFDAIAKGAKTTTIRFDDPVALGPALFVFEEDPERRTLDGIVVSVESHRLDLMTAAEARLAEGKSIADLQLGLRSHYPDLPEDAVVDVVTFRLMPADRR